MSDSLSEQHICFWVRGSWDSASAVRSRELGSELAKQGRRVSFIADRLGAEEEPPIHPHGEVALAAVQHLDKFDQDVRQAILRFQPTYLHILNPSVKHWWVLRKLPELKMIGDWEDCHAVSHRVPRRWIDCLIERWALSRCAIVIAVSRQLQRRFWELGRSDAGYIPYAVLPRQFPIGDSPFDHPTAVWMGSLKRESELRFLVDVCSCLQSQGCSARVTLVGGGRRRAMVENLIRRRGLENLGLAGRLPWDDMLLHLRHAHVLLLPLEDNRDNQTRCPFKALQYAQARRPIIACAVGEVPFMLGNEAYYVPYEARAFAEAVAELTKDPKSEDVDYNLKYHTWAERADRLSQLIDQVEANTR